MAEPTITFGFRHSNATDVEWPFDGSVGLESSGWKEMVPSTDTIVFTGGGILGTLPVPTCASGTRDATIKPSIASYIIPQTFVERDQMYITYAGYNTNRYVFAAYVHGTASSDLYLEGWDDNSFSTTDIELFTGTTNNGGNSCVNAIRTTQNSPPWHPGWDGSDSEAAYLRGVEHRIALHNSSSVTNDTVYWNMYIELPTDISTFHVTPVLAVRYLYT